MLRSILLLLLLVAGATQATEWDDVVERAFDAMEDDLSDNFAYTETRRNDDRVFIGRYDPRFAKGGRWKLTSVDGREPSDDEVEDFLEQKNRVQENKSDDDTEGIASIVADGSLVLLSETEAHWLFGFQPAADTEDEVDFMKFVDGTLMIVKEGHYVSQITMQNSQPIKPGKGIKIQEFRTTMDFAPVQEGGPAVPRKIQSRVRGKAMFVIKINETETLEYSDFVLVAE